MRSLLDLVAEDCGATSGTDDRGLVAVDPLFAVTTDLRDFVDSEIGAGRVYRTAAELTGAGGGLQLLLFVACLGRERRIWAVDGWGLLRRAGTGIDLREANLRGARLIGARLAGADLREADLRGADLTKADLSRANLAGANLAGADLYRASLLEADLTEAELCRSLLQNADLQRARCVRTAFGGADAGDAYLWDIDVSQAFMDGFELERASDFLGKRVTRATARTRAKEPQ